MDVFHAFVDLRLDAESALDRLSHLVPVELVSAGDNRLVDPISAHGFFEEIEGNLVTKRRPS